MKILIAEDDTDSLVYLEKLLRSADYSVESATNGVEAWALVQHSPPDLIISDILMPEMDGFALCLHLKRDHNLKGKQFTSRGLLRKIMPKWHDFCHMNWQAKWHENATFHSEVLSDYLPLIN